MTTSGFLTVPFFLEGTDMYAFVPSRLAEHYAEQLGLTVAQTQVPRATLIEAVYWHPSKSSDPAVQWFIGILRKAAELVEFGDETSATRRALGRATDPVGNQFRSRRRRRTAVDGDLRTREVTRRIREQEGDDLGHFGGGTRRSRGVRVRCASSIVAGADVVMSVSMNPGCTMLTRMPRGPSSVAAEWVSPRSPHLLVVYATG